ncbi:MAG: hypothetical protein PHZ19_02505 [Candidatus Thermoplasmatota archaeon]|nr:hypothetical protein [Candidatus Thermoplasmatota archaeon]
MTETVKTALLKALEGMLAAGLPEIPTVRRDWLFPLDLAAIPLPGLFFYEDEEDLGNLGGQVAKNSFPLDLVVFAAFSEPVFTENSPAWQEFKDWADSLAGKLHALWHDRTNRLALKAAGLIQLEELGSHKAPCNEDYGELVLTYRLTYGHALGDAFSLELT